MSMTTSHESFGHMQPKLWAKEGTTKSQESTRSRRALGERDMALESSQGELQDWFRARPDRRSGREVMMAQSLGSPNRDSFGTPLWESRDTTTWVWAQRSNTENTIWGKVVDSPESGPW
jgi:hypothetical protein